MCFEHPPDKQLSERIEFHVGNLLGVTISVLLYATIGRAARSLLSRTQLSAESSFNAWPNQLLQDVLLGTLVLMVLGIIMAALYIIYVKLRDTASPGQ